MAPSGRYPQFRTDLFYFIYFKAENRNYFSVRLKRLTLNS